MKCKIENCNKDNYARGWCRNHYMQWWKTGTPIPTRASYSRIVVPHGKQYMTMYMPKHPAADKRGYVKRSRLVMEKQLGRLLQLSEIVHHINGDTMDDRPENLQVMTQSEHVTLHNRTRKRGRPSYL